ncbi:glycosyltransferase family 2 protein [Brevibacillus panacihumi]|uniref:glycosyltransferase family 2 protein n=1 Tax=Brevibacillus panacihumi TaxID=497735 RepID=UPI003CFFE909
MLNNHSMPLVSIITPSYNQAAFIKQTIESVLRQDYPRIEHIVVDGASSDGTQAILRQYSQLGERFRYISEPDGGQSHAINKGLKMAKGEIIGWLNSDDTYFPQAVRKAVDSLLKHPDWSMVYGKGLHINEANKIMYKYPWVPFDRKKMFTHCIICQPTAFIRKSIFEEVGGVDEDLHFCMDYDLWLRISAKYPIGCIEDYLASSRLHDKCKSVTSLIDVGFPEIVKTSMRHFGTVANEWLLHFLKTYRDKGVFWFLDLFKFHRLFGSTPSLASSNRFADLWAPPYMRMHFHVDSSCPLHTLVIKGSYPPSMHPMHFHALVEGQQADVRVHTDADHVFTMEIPIQSNNPTCFVDVIASRQIVKEDPLPDQNKRTVSYLVDQILPLSEEEYSFYQHFLQGSNPLSEWIKQNRHPSPNL